MLYLHNKQEFSPIAWFITGFLYAKPPDIGQFCEMLWDYAARAQDE